MLPPEFGYLREKLGEAMRLMKAGGFAKAIHECRLGFIGIDDKQFETEQVRNWATTIQKWTKVEGALLARDGKMTPDDEGELTVAVEELYYWLVGMFNKENPDLA